MSVEQSSSIDNLPQDISREDLELVNDILNDIGNSNNQGSAQTPVQTSVQKPEISREEMIVKQKMLEQAQQQAQENNYQDLTNVNTIQRGAFDDIIDMVKYESKSIFLVIVLALLFNLEQSNSILSYYSGAFVDGTNVLSTQGIMIKAIVMGLIYFIIKSQFF